MTDDKRENPTVAVVIPCYNEALTVAKVVQDFRRVLPDADIYVFDNASTDDTARCALAAGAMVIPVAAKGKGNVVRSMFRDVDADVVLMVDGDDTYPADAALLMLEDVIAGRADMVVGTRLESHDDASFRRFHGFGNKLVRWSIGWLIGSPIRDVLSGYRAFSRRFVESMPVLSRGFEIETEMTVFALTSGFLITERTVAYGVRPEGSHSKLNTFRDGARVMRTIFFLFKDMRPLLFFSCLAALSIIVGLLCGLVVLSEFTATGLVTRPSTAVLAVAFTLTGIISLATGLILDTVNRRSSEILRLITDQLVSTKHSDSRGSGGSAATRARQAAALEGQ
ncbi:glycosyltransferase [Pseudoxanthomonas gei]|uniref:Glycosyltransferase n=1 Tax=Pseudoxanthomonas gei TaxID=1383030 RepID=A0ABX0ALB2_9GAMM|nr:glycosyltransferase [Pseudoxanthomonas gei]NDK40043.1 glycosyltransferase [Pseudoxanthomonas gei]